MRLTFKHKCLYFVKFQITFKQPLRSLNIIIMGKKLYKKGKIPSFIRKLVQILQDKKFADSVSWLIQGCGFQILNVPRFNEQVLPAYFKHKNLASFIRQLNMYGFVRPKDSDQYVYYHERFQRGNTNAMRFIRRKNAAGTPEGKDAELEQSSSQFIISSQKNNLSQLFQNLLKENQELKKINVQLNAQIQFYKKQMKQDCKSSEAKSQVPTVQESILNQKLYFTPIQVDNKQKTIQPNPCFGVFSNFLAYYPEFFYQNQLFAEDNSRRGEERQATFNTDKI